ncbi:hypothetical protein I317_05147 [Kwoniella heveanensis CBS 569]|nr:hypothetical protein I317_05147 [Kwoniella heveanensis CBS 569]
MTKAWRRLVLLHHPDKNLPSVPPATSSSTNEDFAPSLDIYESDSRSTPLDIRLINEARSVLSDPSKREIWQQSFLSSNIGNALGLNGKTPLPTKDEGPHVFRNVSLDEFEPHYTPRSQYQPGQSNDHTEQIPPGISSQEERLNANEGNEEDGSDDEDPLWWSYPCRCSSTFVITLEQLEQGVEVIGCEGCGEWMRVGYQAVEDTGET